MKKINRNNKYLMVSLYAFGTVGAIMLLWKILFTPTNLLESIQGVLNYLWSAISVVVGGLILSYILEPLVEGIVRVETHIFKKCRSKKAQKRMFNIAVLIVYLLFFVAVVLIISFLVPALVKNIADLAKNMQKYVDQVLQWYDNHLKDNPALQSKYVEEALANLEKNAEKAVKENLLSVASGVAGGIFSMVGGIFSFTLVVTISIYGLLNSKKIWEGIEEFSAIRFGERKTNRVKDFIQSVDYVFGKYISAKLIQITIMFIITQITFAVMGVQLSTLLALFVAVCNIIPFVGPIIGAIPAVLFSLFDSVGLAIGVVIAIIIIQQIDAYLIDPFLIGDKMGLSPFWVITGVVISSNLFGLVGVILCVPVMAVIRLFIKRYVIREKEKARRIQSDS